MADKKPSKEELMKAVADVLDEAIETYGKLEKMDGTGIDAAQTMPDPSKAHQPGSDEAAGQVDGVKDPNANPAPRGNADTHADGVKGPKEAVLKDGDSKDDEDEEKKKKDKKDQDDKDMYAFKSMASDLEKRGLIKKASDSIAKSEAAAPAAQATAPAATPNAEIESLKKSFADSIGDLSKKIGEIAEKVEKIAAAPAAPRRGLSGATPLRKSEEASGSAPAFSKLEALDRLVDLRKSGDKRVDTGLIARVELGKLTQGDVERLNGILA